MKNNLQSIANKLSEDDIQEIIRLKKMGDKKLAALCKKRDRLLAQLAEIDAQLGETPAGDQPAPKRRGRKPGRKPAAKAEAPAKKGGARRGKQGSIIDAVREVFKQATNPLKARDVVDALPAAGIKVKNVAAMRKRMSILLSSRKQHFKNVGRGLYELEN